MDGIAARDARVLEILTAPDEYFLKARRKAWAKARSDVQQDLARRAEARKSSGTPTRPGARSQPRLPGA